MVHRIDPIYLWGFCFETQQRQRFNNTWACAFHTSWYTNEDHPLWDDIDDASKKREIRYGNNICVLFRVLLHCKTFYNHSSLWSAIGKGFNTSPTVVRQTAEILTEARRLQRDKPSKDVSETARAADDWIEFLDNRGLQPTRFPAEPAIVYKAAEEFFRSQEKKLLNAAHVPVSQSYRPSSNPNPYPPRKSRLESTGPTSNQSPSSTSRTSNPLSTGYTSKPSQPSTMAPDTAQPTLSSSLKRSASPISHPAKARRVSLDTRQQQTASTTAGQDKALDQLPAIKIPKGPKNSPKSCPPPLNTQPNHLAKNEKNEKAEASPQTSSTSSLPAPPSERSQPSAGATLPDAASVVSQPAPPSDSSHIAPIIDPTRPPISVRGMAKSMTSSQAESPTKADASPRSDQNHEEKGSHDVSTDTPPGSKAPESMTPGSTAVNDKVSKQKLALEEPIKLVQASTGSGLSTGSGPSAASDSSTVSGPSRTSDSATVTGTSAASGPSAALGTPTASGPSTSSGPATASGSSTTLGPATVPGPSTPLTTSSGGTSRLREDVTELKANMKTATNAITTMMDSMHDVVDGLSSLQEEIACLNDQQKSLAANVEASCGNIDLTPILKPIETLTSSLDSFKTELAEVKKTQAEILDKIQQQAPPTPATNSTAQIETLIQAQNATMDKLLKEMAALRKEQQQQRTATPQSATPFLQHPQPQNIRQALAFAEQDLRRHLTTLQALYHRGGVSRALTERTAEFMALLGSSVKAAQAGRTEV
jgi:hypothetical protein